MEPPNDRTADAGNGAVADKPKKKGGFKLALIMFVVAIAGGATVAFVMYDSLVAMANGTDPADLEPKTEVVEYGSFHEIQGLIVNPAESGGKRYLMVTLAIEVGNEAVIEEIKDKDIVIRDQVLGILGAHTADELADINVRESLKSELLTAVETIVGKGKVQRLFFTQYVLQ